MIKLGLRKSKIDKTLLALTMTLIIIGIILVLSASWPEGVLKYENGYYFFIRHLRSLALGAVAMFVAIKFNYKYYRKFSIPIILIALFLNFLLFSNFGDDRLGSTRWLDLPFLPAFMPSDVLKIAATIFLAFLLSGMGDNIRKSRGVILTAAFIVLCVGVVLLKDMGSAMVILIALGVMLFVAGIKIHSLAILIGLGGLVVYLGIQNPRFAYRMRRIVSFIDPFADKSNHGYQLVNSLFAFALGGLTGSGIGRGVLKFQYIPHVYNDFIFSVMGEEFGLIGTATLVLLFLIFIWKGFTIASKCRDKFGKYLAVGLTTIIAAQTFIHMMVNIGLAPVTGITLPFISYGGTSLIMTMYTAGILLNISKENNRSTK